MADQTLSYTQKAWYRGLVAAEIIALSFVAFLAFAASSDGEESLTVTGFLVGGFFVVEGLRALVLYVTVGRDALSIDWKKLSWRVVLGIILLIGLLINWGLSTTTEQDETAPFELTPRVDYGLSTDVAVVIPPGSGLEWRTQSLTDRGSVLRQNNYPSVGPIYADQGAKFLEVIISVSNPGTTAESAPELFGGRLFPSIQFVDDQGRIYTPTTKSPTLYSNYSTDGLENYVNFTRIQPGIPYRFSTMFMIPATTQRGHVVISD